MFEQGSIVKSKLRPKDFPLFLLVMEQKEVSNTYFTGVIIKNKAYLPEGEELDQDELPGFYATNWHIKDFEPITPELTKETLKDFLNQHPAISPRGLALHAGVNENAINQLYNKSDKTLTEELKTKLMTVLPLYGWE